MNQFKLVVLLSILYSTFTAPVSSLAQENNLLNWSNGKLAWTDYQGNSEESNENAILSYINFTFKADIQGNGKMLDVEVISFFNRSASYVGESIKTEDLLQREQLHFDITEKYARLFRKELQSQKWESKTFQKEFSRIYKQFSNDNKAEQKNCDRETKKGKDAAKVSEWITKIEKDLKKLDKYSAPAFTTKLKT